MPYGHFSEALPMVPMTVGGLRAQVRGWTGHGPAHESQVAECVASHAQLDPEAAVAAAESTLAWLRSPEARAVYGHAATRQQVRVWSDAIPRLRVLAQECG